ncbi:putative uncharacterized protein [Bacteroides clarus CAG:160]|nr:putative uncharacterized protein [Bacteroides clarus CAG:160]
MSAGQILPYPTGSADKIDRIVIMLVHTRSHSKYIRVKNYILRIETDLIYQQTISTFTHFNSTFIRIRLPLFIKSHYDCSSTIPFYSAGMFKKLLLALFQGYGIDNGLSLRTF